MCNPLLVLGSADRGAEVSLRRRTARPAVVRTAAQGPRTVGMRVALAAGMRYAILLPLLLAAGCVDDAASGDGSTNDGGLPPPLSAGDTPPGGAQQPPAQQPRPPADPPSAEASPDAGPPGEMPPEQPPPGDPPPEEPPPEEEPLPDEQPPPEPDACADAGGPCEICACRLCAAELEACFADAACEAVVECARRTGCSGLDCLNACRAEIDAAGGPFGDAVRRAQAVSECRDEACGTDAAVCAEIIQPPQEPDPPPPGPEEPDGPDEPEPGPDQPPPAPGGCARFPAALHCASGVLADGTAFCDFYVESRGRTCEQVCAAAGSRCLDGWSDEDDDCVIDSREGCRDRADDQICRCAQ